MIDQINYKVLWVDDDESIIDAYATLAEVNYNLSLDVAPDWETAEEKLRVHFREYSAIILDANCKLNKSDSKPSEFFLGQASVRLSRIFGEKHEFIPWYILSAGTMNQFDTVLALINTEERQNMEFVWGELLYRKDSLGEDGPDALFKRIVEVSNDKTINKVLLRHADVFKYLGKGKLIDYVQARNYMLKMLSALYNPEENLNFEYEGNPLRKVLEYVFRTALDYGLIPEVCKNDEKSISPQLASLFMSGRNVRIPSDKCNTSVRYGKEEDALAIFPQEISTIVKNLIQFSNEASHTSEKTTASYFINYADKEIFFGYTLLLCNFIKWFGHYVEQHPNKEENLSFHCIITTPQSGQVKADKKAVQGVTTKKKEVPTKESLIGSTGFVTNTGKVGQVKGCCKLMPEDKQFMFKTIRILELKENDGSDSEQYPYIVSKLELA